MNQSTADEESHPPMPEDPPPYPGEHSLPTVEEARTEAAIIGLSYTKQHRRLLVIGLVSLVAFVGIISFSAGIAVSSRNSAAASVATTSQTSSQGDEDGEPVVGQESDQAGDDTPVDRLPQVKEFLGDFVSALSALESPGTPQYKAAAWIANQDELQVPVPDSRNYQTSFSFVQRYVLAVFFFSTGGHKWTFQQTGFLSLLNECDWAFGLKPPPGSDEDEWYMGAQCNENKEVNEIFLPANNLVGELPVEINFLGGMEHFSLFGNSISGPLVDISDWVDLKYLNLEDNQLTGSIGSWFRFPKLEYLDLGDNQLSGPLPSFEWATSLKEISLDANSFSGPIDVFIGATSLQKVLLQNNTLVGPLNDQIFPEIELHTLDLSDNMITGSIPHHFFGFEVVDLHNNLISGNLPSVPYSGYPIKFFSVYDNKIEGSVEENIGLLTEVTHLDLSNNLLSGPMPESFNTMVKLEYLFLHRNNFDEGSIPYLGAVTNLKELSLKGTNRVSTVPKWLGSLTNLVILDLHDNRLEGPVPETFGDLTNLRFLFLNKNKLNETLPASMGYMQALTMLVLDKNDFTGNDKSVCGYNKPANLNYFIADCEEVICECCHKCCTDSDTACNDMEISVNLDDGYTRDEYVFSEDLKFSVRPPIESSAEETP